MRNFLEKLFSNRRKYIILIIIGILFFSFIIYPDLYTIYLRFYLYDSLHTSSLYFFERGVYYTEKGYYKLAEKSFKNAIHYEDNKFVVNPRNRAQVESIFNLGVLNYRYFKDYNKAVFYFNRYMDIYPTNPHKKDIYEVINFILSQDDSSKNAKAKALKTEGNNAFFNKDYKKAISLYEKALAIDPSYVEVYNNLGTVYLELKDYKKAIEYWKTYLLFNPADADIYINVALAYDEALKKYREAINYYNLFLQKANKKDKRIPLVKDRIKLLQQKLLRTGEK